MSRRSRPHYRSGPEWILGVAFEDTLTRPARLAQGFTSVRCCGAPRASSPHGLAAPALASRDGRDCVQLPPARGCYHLAPRRTFTSNPVPMPGTRRVGAKDYSSAPLTEPDVRASHPALWIDISEVQRELNRNLRRVKVVPQDFERGHPSGEPCRRIGSRHCPNVGLHPCSLAAVRAGGGSFRADASGLQVPEEKARTLPLSDDDRPDAAADMGVDDAQSLDRLRRTQPEVRYPARQVSADAFHAGSEGPPPIRRRHFPHFRPQPSHRLAGGKHGDLFIAVLPPRAAEAEAQELNLVGSANATLLLVDLEPHARLQKSPDRCHDAPPGALAAHENIAIIGVANEPQAPPRQFAVQFVEHDVGKQWRERTPLRRSFLDYDLRPIWHHPRRLQHQANQGDYPQVRHAFREPGQQSLMMNSVEEFGQVQINHRSIAVLQIFRCFGNGGMSAASGAETVTAGVESGLEDRLQYLEQSLLNHPIHDVGNAEPSLPAPWLWQPDAADFAGPVASLQQVSAQTGDQRRGLRLGRLDRLTIHSWRSLVAHYVQQRPGQIGLVRCRFEQPTRIGRAGVGTDRFLALRFLQQKVSRRGCVRALSLSVPRRAVGEHEAQLPGSRLSQSISSLAPLAFTSLLATMRRSDFCVGVVPSSFPPSGLPPEAAPRSPPGVMTLDVPPLPPPLPLRPRMDFGRRVRRHADPAGPACSGVHSRSVLRFASGFFPTRPRGASAGVSRRQGLRAVASGSRLLPPRPAKDFHLQSSAHARHTSFVRPMVAAMKDERPRMNK